MARGLRVDRLGQEMRGATDVDGVAQHLRVVAGRHQHAQMLSFSSDSALNEARKYMGQYRHTSSKFREKQCGLDWVAVITAAGRMKQRDEESKQQLEDVEHGSYCKQPGATTEGSLRREQEYCAGATTATAN